MSGANGVAELRIEYKPVGNNGSATLTAAIGDDVIGHAKVDLGKPKARTEFVEGLTKGRPGIDGAAVEQELLRIGAELSAQSAKADEQVVQPDSQELLQKMPEHVRNDARAMLESPDLFGRCYQDISALGVAGEGELVAAIYLVGVSRLLPKPLSVIVQAPSSTGKSYTVEKTTSPFPPETVIHATSLTANALYYMDAGSLRNKLVVAGERSRRQDDDTAEVTRALREMQSAGRLTKAVPQKIDGKIKTDLIEQEGPIAYIETTTLSEIFDEDLNRCLLLHADEREQQTRNVVTRLAKGYSGAIRPNTEAIIQRHHALQRMLQQRPVSVPFAEQLADRFPTERVEARRAFPHLMGMIQACALLHQFQRQLDGDGQIVASVADYEMARHLCRGPLARLLGDKINDSTLHYHERLAKWAVGADSFTTTEAYKKDRTSDRAVRDWLKELTKAGAVEQLTEGKGNRPATWKLVEPDNEKLKAGDCGLPEAGEIKT